jgi:hypothetical protein
MVDAVKANSGEKIQKVADFAAIDAKVALSPKNLGAELNGGRVANARRQFAREPLDDRLILATRWFKIPAVTALVDGATFVSEGRTEQYWWAKYRVASRDEEIIAVAIREAGGSDEGLLVWVETGWLAAQCWSQPEAGLASTLHLWTEAGLPLSTKGEPLNKIVTPTVIIASKKSAPGFIQPDGRFGAGIGKVTGGPALLIFDADVAWSTVAVAFSALAEAGVRDAYFLARDPADASGKRVVAVSWRIPAQGKDIAVPIHIVGQAGDVKTYIDSDTYPTEIADLARRVRRDSRTALHVRPDSDVTLARVLQIVALLRDAGCDLTAEAVTPLAPPERRN